MKIHQYNEMMRYLTRPAPDPSFKQQVARGPAHVPFMAPELQENISPMPNIPDLLREEGIQVGPQVKASSIKQQVASNPLNIPAHMQHQLDEGQLTPEEFYQRQSIPQSERPLTGAEGGRVQMKPGGLVEPGVTHYGGNPVKTEHLGEGLYETTYKKGSKSYYGKVTRKGKTLKYGNTDKQKVLEWIEKKKKLKKAPTVIEQQATKGLLLEQPKYKKALANALEELYLMEDKGYGAVRNLTNKYNTMFSKKGTIQFGKKIATDVTTEGTAIVNAIRSEAKALGIDDINSKNMEKALDFYLSKKNIKKGDIVKIAARFDVPYNTLHGALSKKDYRKVIPKKYGSKYEKHRAQQAAKNAAIRKYSNWGYEQTITGTLKTQLGHMSDVYSQYTTAQDLGPVPAKINQEALKDIDAAHKSIYEKRDKLFKNKPSGWQKEVERLNAKGIFLAEKSQGYKNFNIKRVDGSTYKYGVIAAKTIDPTNITKGKKIKDIAIKLDPSNPKSSTVLDLDPVDRHFFEENRKAVFQAQDKMGKKQIKTIIEKIGCSGLAAGGRVSFKDGSTCYTRGLEKIRIGEIKPGAEEFNFKKLAKLAGGARGIARATGLGLAWEAAFAPIIVGWMGSEGESWERMKHELAYGPILEGIGVPPEYVPGKSAKEEQIEYFGKPGYNVSRMGEIGDEYANLQAQESAEINRAAEIGGKPGRVSFKLKQIQDQMKKLQDEYMQVSGTFYEGPAGQHVGYEKLGQALQDKDWGEFDLQMDKEARKEELRKKGFLAEEDWMKNLSVSRSAGGRVGFKGGKLVDEGRRAFMKWLAGITGAGVAGATGLLKWGKIGGKGTTAIKAGDKIIQGTPGMPDWFIPLVNRIVKEGDDVTKKLGTVEREIVHTKKIAPGEEVTVYQNLDTGNVRVDYTSPDIMGEGAVGPVSLEYRAGEVITEGKHAGKKTKPEFEAVESEPVGHTMGPDDYAIEWDGENVVGRVEDLMSDTSKLKQYATKKKPTMREIVESSKKKKAVQKVHENESDYIVDKQGDYVDYDDYLPDIDDID